MPLTRILVRLPNWLGDLLMARPALHALKSAHPAAELRAVTSPGLAGLAAWEPWWHDVGVWPRDGRERASRARALRDWRPDAALVMPPSFSSAWWMWRIGARQRVGYRGEGRRLLLTSAPRRAPRGALHLAAEYLRLVGLLSAEARTAGPVDGEVDVAASVAAVPSLPVPEVARDRASALLHARRVGARYVVIGPGAIYGPAKRWSAERFAAVGRELVADGLEILVCGIRSEQDTCLEVARGIDGARSLAGETDLEVQAALCAGAALVVSNDSGLGHLAAATGAPTVSVFGSTSSAWTAPLGPRVRVVQRSPVCAPCFQRTCRIGYRCLEAVDAARVVRACRELLAA